MAIKLDLTDLNKLFNTPSINTPSYQRISTAADKVWLEQFYARVHLIETLNTQQLHVAETTLWSSSPSSSNATLVDDDECDSFMVSKFDDPFFAIPNLQADLQRFSIMNERSRYVEEIHRMTENRKALSLNTDLSSYPLDSTPTSTISSVSSFGFNPDAAPFIPADSSVSPSSTPPPTSDVLDVSWFPTFWAGVSTADLPAQQTYAVSLLEEIQCAPEALAVLSQHLCWKAAEGPSDAASAVASFGRAVHDQLREKHGDWNANCLTRHIRECVVGHFKACWKSEHPESITFANPPSSIYLSSALSLTTFVGDLYAQGLLPRSAVHHCLSVLVAELNSIEHIHAIHLILLHANARLWRGSNALKAGRDFMTSFAQRATSIPEDASIVGHAIKKSEMKAWISEITEMVQKWQVVRRGTDSVSSKDYNAGDKVLSFGLQMSQRR